MSGTRAISTTSRRELSSSSIFPARQGAEEIHVILTEILACFRPGQAKDLSAPLYACGAKTPNQLRQWPKKSANSKTSVLQSRIRLYFCTLLHPSTLKKGPVFLIFRCSGIDQMLMRWRGLHIDTCCKVSNLRFGSLHIFRTLVVSLQSLWTIPSKLCSHTCIYHTFLTVLPLNQIYVHCSLCPSATTRYTNTKFRRRCTGLRT